MRAKTTRDRAASVHKSFIPFYPNTLAGVPKPSRASHTLSSVIISLGRSRGATTRLENR